MILVNAPEKLGVFPATLQTGSLDASSDRRIAALHFADERTALLKTSKADVDLHLGGWGHWPSVLQIPPQTLARMDHPARLSQLEQVKLFRYALNVEGHGGWAGSLYSLTREAP